jgi:DNA-directed RNA polymerase I, II, and III subunit RPABC3
MLVPLQSFTSGRRTLMDNFDYVMHGKVFKYKDNSSSGQLKADVSG